MSAIDLVNLMQLITDFQTILTKWTGQNGWHNSARTWTPALFEAVLRDDQALSSKIDRLRDKFVPVILLNGLDEPSLRTIPRKFRAIRSDGPIICKVMRSEMCGGDEDGLFAIANIPIGTTWLMGGVPCKKNERMNTFWEPWNARIGLPEGVRESFHGERCRLKMTELLRGKRMSRFVKMHQTRFTYLL